MTTMRMRMKMTNQNNKEFYTESTPESQRKLQNSCIEMINSIVAEAKRPKTDEELNKWVDGLLKDDMYKDWPEEKKALFKKIMIKSKKAEPDIWDESLAFRTMIDIETIEECKRLVLKQNGEGTKFERTNIEHEQNEFERIRGEYNVQEN